MSGEEPFDPFADDRPEEPDEDEEITEEPVEEEEPAEEDGRSFFQIQDFTSDGGPPLPGSVPENQLEALFLNGSFRHVYFTPGDKGKFKPATLSAAIQHLYKIKTIMGTEWREVYFYDNDRGLWGSNGRDKIKEIVKKALGMRYKEYHYKNTIGDITASTLVNREDFTEEADLMPFNNGVYKIETRELLPFSPDYNFTSKLTANYDPEATCPEFMAFLASLELSDESLTLLQEFLGYTLWYDARFKLALMLHGPKDSGKTTTINVMKRLLGRDQYETITLSHICMGKWYTARLLNKRLNACGEINPTSLKETDIFKQLTGNEEDVEAELKHGTPFKLKWGGKLAFAHVVIPLVSHETEDFYERWGFAIYHKQFPRDSRDPNLLDKLTTPEELAGIANWALEGLHRIIPNGGFTSLPPSEERKDYWLTNSSVLYAYIVKSGLVVRDPAGTYDKESFYNDCAQYAADNDRAPGSKNMIGRRMNNFPYVRSFNNTIPLPNGDILRMHVWKGIRRRESYE